MRAECVKKMPENLEVDEKVTTFAHVKRNIAGWSRGSSLGS